MNYLQFSAFIIYLFVTLTAGIGCYTLLNPHGVYKNRALYLGETLLLGSILIIGEMLSLSLIHLYHGCYLWGFILLNFTFLSFPSVRRQWGLLFKKSIVWDVPLVACLFLMALFLFRNLYFLVDVDSHSTYLYVQKLWLEHGTSLFASRALDMKIFVPHFNAVPYALGISLFPKEPLFPQLIVTLWTIIVLLLVFGYVSGRIGRAYALMAVMLCLFNDHMFYSGANSCCIINSALIALIFASTYNFWEARVHQDPFRFALALIFLIQLMANKYQVFYIFILLLVAGIFIQNNFKKDMSSILKNRRWLIGILLSLVIAGLWYLKNLLATGSPVFPIFGDKLGWVKEMSSVFNKVFVGPLTFPKIIKFLSFLFVWPGIGAAKIVWMTIMFFPVLLVLGFRHKDFNKAVIFELCYWLGISLLVLIGICLVNFVDPRVYRYGIAVMAVASIFSLEFIFTHCLSLPRKITLILILCIALQGWRIIFAQASSYKYPTFKQNIAVLTNRLHMKDLIPLYYPDNLIVEKQYKQNSEKFKFAAWDSGVGGVTSLSAYLLPSRPQVGLWYTTAVDWESYQSLEAIADDLHRQHIDWIMHVSHGELVFESVSEYAKRAIEFDRHPKDLFYNYGFPQELARYAI